jgi:hypothetical protein
MIAVPNFRRLCQGHGRVERIWVDQTGDFILVWYSNWYGANQAFHRLRGQMQPWYDSPFKVELVKPNGAIEQMSVENPASDAEFQGVPFVKADTSDDWVGVQGVKQMEDLSRAPHNYHHFWQPNEGYYAENNEGSYSVTQERDYSPDDIYYELQRDYSPDGVYEDFRRDFSPERGFQNGIRLDATMWQGEQNMWNVDAPAFQPVNGQQNGQRNEDGNYPFDVIGLPYPSSKGGKAGAKGGKSKDAPGNGSEKFEFNVNAPVFRSTSPDSMSPPPMASVPMRNPLEAVEMARVRHATDGLPEVQVPAIHNPLRPDNPPMEPIIPPVASAGARVPRPVGELAFSTSSSELRERKVAPDAGANLSEAETTTTFQVPEWTESINKPDKEALVRFEGRTKKPKGLAGIRLKDMANIPQDDPYSVTDTLLWYLMRMVCFYCLVRGLQVGFVMYYTSD